VNSNPVELRDLGLRHPVLRQSADATKLGGRYLAGLAPDRCYSPYLLRCRSRFGLRCILRHHQRAREDTWLPSGWCSAEGASFGADVGTPARVSCCVGLNRSSAFWRVLLIRSRSLRVLAVCQSVGKRYLSKKLLTTSGRIRICREVRKGPIEQPTRSFDRLQRKFMPTTTP